jgi:UDP-3-O-[3-hydroxymyristoyl] glucosamine N-acyltransferase
MKLSSPQVSKKAYTLDFLASHTSSKLVGDANFSISGAQSIELAKHNEVSFVAHNRYTALIEKSSSGVIIVPNNYSCVEGKNYLLSDDPSRAFQKILTLFHNKIDCRSGISDHAYIASSASIDNSVNIAPGCVVGQDSIIGANTTLMPGVIIGKNVVIGSNCILYPAVVVQDHCTIGQRVILQPGAIIGSCGYGYFSDKRGNHEKIEHFGNVILENDVEIGANTTIDRARFNSTIIGKGTKIDNLVQIAHNVILGQNNLIVSQTGISGSTSTGDRVILGGQCGIVGHIHITNDVILAAKGGFSKSIKESGIYSGAPAQPLQQYNRNSVQLRGIDKAFTRIKQLEKKLALLEDMLDM